MDAAEMRLKGQMPPKDCSAKCGESGMQTYKVISTSNDSGKD